MVQSEFNLEIRFSSYDFFRFYCTQINGMEKIICNYYWVPHFLRA
jgi:hypothetical protein